MIKTAGDQPLGRITRAKILDGIDRRRDTPNQARHFLDALRDFFQWAVKAQHADADPTAGLTPPARSAGGGFKIWNEAELQAYEQRWSIGTRQRVWLDVLLYTGLRRGDAVRLGRQHIRDVKLHGGRTIRVFQLPTEKSGETIIVTLPILPPLEATLAVRPSGDLAFICGAGGQPLTKESFGNEFRGACRAAGIKKNPHTACARWRQRERQTMVQPRPSSRRCSPGGVARASHGSTPRLLIASSCRSAPRTSCSRRTLGELLSSHLAKRCDAQS